MPINLPVNLETIKPETMIPVPDKSTSPLGLRLAQTYLTIALPFLLALISIRLIMTPLFLQIEYTRPGFPEDYYGFTTQERLVYAPYAIQYLLNAEDISFLGDLKSSDGKPIYNVRELQHMRDVKIVTQYAYLIAIFIGILALILAIPLYRTNFLALCIALSNGSILTLAIIASIVILAVLNWDYFFTSFHSLFFSTGTWRFEYSDTLIRLFPEQFWFDASLTIGGLTTLSSIMILAAANLCRRGVVVHHYAKNPR